LIAFLKSLAGLEGVIDQKKLKDDAGEEFKFFRSSQNRLDEEYLLLINVSPIFSVIYSVFLIIVTVIWGYLRRIKSSITGEIEKVRDKLYKK
jgi:hypothetical protein